MGLGDPLPEAAETLSAQLTFLLVVAGLSHVWFQLYCRRLLLVADGPAKVPLQQISMLLIVIVPALLLLVFRHEPAVAEALRWSPRTGGARLLFAGFAALWLLMLWRMASGLSDRLMPPRSVHLASEETRIPSLPRPGYRLPRILRLIETTYDLELTEREIVVPDLAAEFDGLTIAQVSDAHYDPRFGQADYFDAIADLVNSLHADVVVFTGDFINHLRFAERSCRWHSKMQGRLATIGVLGNHDYWTNAEKLRDGCARVGIRLMDDKRWVIERDGRRLIFAGTDHPWNHQRVAWRKLAEKRPGDALILLSHTPDNAPTAAERGVNLVLSGHNHGGQYCLPGIGPLVVPSKLGQRHVAGVYDVGANCVVHVSRGIGTSDAGSGHGGGRTLCPPEVVLLTLRAPCIEIAVPAIEPARVAKEARAAATPLSPGS